MTTLSSYLAISNNLTKWQALTARTPAVATQTKYFQANIGLVKSAADLVANPRLFNYAMTAFGLGDRSYAKGLMKQVLQQGVSSSTALANKLNDSNIRKFATAFDFASKGAATTSSSALVKSVTDLYAENALEVDQGQQNPGVELALYFQRKAPGITSAYGLLADKKLLTVVQTALDISPSTSMQPVDTQARLLAAKVKFADFKDPAKLQAFIARFSAMYDYNNGGSVGGGATSTNAILFGASQSAGDGLNASLLQSLQTFRSQS